MVLSTTKRTSSMASITNQNQGGGNKKAGFPYIVGRGSWSSIFFHSTAPVYGGCCNLKKVMTMTFPAANPSRPIGSDVRIPAFRI
jgi:hypothetical protein